MNEQTVKGKWNELKGELKKTWGKLTDDELDVASGNASSIAGIIQQKYGTAKEQISEELHKVFDKYGHKFNDKAENFKETLKNTPEKSADVPPESVQ